MERELKQTLLTTALTSAADSASTMISVGVGALVAKKTAPTAGTSAPVIGIAAGTATKLAIDTTMSAFVYKKAKKEMEKQLAAFQQIAGNE